MTDPLGGTSPLQLSPLAQWAALHGPKSPILDVSSPPGIVSRTLAQRGRDVVCVNPRAALAEALAHEFENRVEVKIGQMTSLPVPSHSIGSVVAVSPDLEGVPLDAALDEFVRVLGDGGLLVVAPEAGPVPEPARRARALRDLQEAVLHRLDHCELIGVSHWMAATLGQGSFVPEITGPRARDADEADPGWGPVSWTVLVASDRPLPPIEDSFVVLSPPEMDQWVGEWHRMLSSLRAAEARAQVAFKKAEERDLLLEELLNSEQQLAEAHDPSTLWESESRSKLQEQVAVLNDRIALLEETVDAANARIAELQRSTSWRLTEPLRRLSDGVGRYTRG